MKAILLVRRRVVLAADAFAEVAVWRVPEPVSPSEHLFKYRLAYVVGGKCVLRYDHERGKGDHRHFGAQELDYVFSTPEQLMLDFNADIQRWNHEHGHS
ncbi:MAG: toxin-antitoxin system TumE family protein [Roseateles sp.]|uniref:toxin-antitoxin system TumE family protein n=1 Tax=Roseateles sp. TaxID=1971397 RepID=UPI0040367E6F